MANSNKTGRGRSLLPGSRRGFGRSAGAQAQARPQAQAQTAFVSTTAGLRFGASEIARIRNGERIPFIASLAHGMVSRKISRDETRSRMGLERSALIAKVLACVLASAVIFFLSLGVMGAQGQYYTYSGDYAMYNPAQVAAVIGEWAYNTFAQITHLLPVHVNEYIRDNFPGYWAVAERASVLGITCVCACLLSISGMLYQNVFKNPIAGPGMLGASSGVSLGMMLLVAIYHTAAPAMIEYRYLFCYAIGGAILIFVMIAGKRLSGRGRPFDIVTMLVIGSIFSQILGFVVSYVTLYVMEEDDYLTFYTMSQMLTVNSSLLSWIILGVVAIAAVVPVFLNRFKLNALAFDEEEARMLGLSTTRLRALALICGAVMILAAQIHVGMVSLVSLVVPFMARSIFGCESSRQLIGNICLGIPLLLFCRTITDLIPFVGDGLAISSVVSIVALPLFIVIMARQMRGWE